MYVKLLIRFAKAHGCRIWYANIKVFLIDIQSYTYYA